MSLFDKPIGIRSHWISFENAISERGQAAQENQGAKGHAFDCVRAGETKTLLDLEETGMICRIWMTIGDRSPEMLRSLRLEMFWDQSDEPAVSTPLGDFFGVGLGRRTPFENALFSDPEGRSFNCFIPMPFRTGARVTLTNESEKDLAHLFYDIDLLLDVEHTPSTLYFHTHWRREAPNELGKEYTILPKVVGAGRFLGCNIGIMPDPAYEGAWWGEGEVKVWFGDDDYPTLCGTGTEDYIGTGWGQGVYANRTQGCLIADKEAGQWCFYRFHLDDPIFFDDACQ
ncbi:MAG TPA: glycoside hydrolase family 172 protein, partial [Fimbriimonadaceae bacterium]|nr:glycoside hydrolase family 172 protein [Fimbriimonadaceae bacterium]